MLEEGLLFADRYKFVKLLGRGGFSEVWLAEDSLTSIQVAVKVYAPGSGLDDAGIKLFTQEFSLVFDMNHTNLLRPTHFDCWNRMPYLILPYCRKGSAFGYLTRGSRITEEECWNMLHDVAAGLAYLHEKVPPVIHQDIKSDNILISDEGHYMITDFGISSRVRSTIRNGMAQEQSGGTLAYMGPERFSATPKPIMASDVWSLGAMMYELMTGGTPPFGNHGGVLQKNGADIPIIEEDYSQELKDIVYGCLAKETWERPSARSIEETAYKKIHGMPLSVTEQPNQPVEVQPEGRKTKKEVETKEDKPEVSERKESNRGNATMKTSVADSKQTAGEKMKPEKPGSGINFKDKRIVYVGIAVAVLVLIISVLTCSGGSTSDEEPIVITEVQPRVNYDSLAQVKIDEAISVIAEADTFLVNHEDDKYDEQYGKVEEFYMKAHNLLTEALTDKDSLSASITTKTTQRMAEVTNALFGIYKEFVKDAHLVEDYKKRAETIRPYVEGLIETNDNNETDNADETDD